MNSATKKRPYITRWGNTFLPAGSPFRTCRRGPCPFEAAEPAARILLGFRVLSVGFRFRVWEEYPVTPKPLKQRNIP